MALPNEEEQRQALLRIVFVVIMVYTQFVIMAYTHWRQQHDRAWQHMLTAAGPGQPAPAGPEPVQSTSRDHYTPFALLVI
jgi:hypothetical protein